MKILVFGDSHGCLSGVENLIKTQQFKDADNIIFLGDICMGGARPNECIELFKTFKNAEFLLGNNDQYACDFVPQVDLQEFSDGKKIRLEITKKLISDKNKKWVASWKRDLTLSMCGKKLYFTHYAWETCNNELNVVDEPENKCFASRQKTFNDINADYIFFGHEHIANHFTDGRKHFYCVGTFGPNQPSAYLISDDSGEISVKEIFVDYDETVEFKYKVERGMITPAK